MYPYNFIVKRNRFLTTNFLLSVLLINGYAIIRIKRLHVPSVVEQGNSAVLNCDYTMDSDDEDGIVITWYLKEVDALYPDLVYQWIPSNREPQDFGKLRNRLTSVYNYGNESSTLHITNTSFELSGEYICKVSSFISEDVAQKNMLVFVAPSNMTILQEIDVGSKQLNIICYAENVYPEPNLKIFTGDREVNISSLLRYGNRSSLYSIQGTTILDNNEAIPEKASCQIDMPEVNYYNRVEASFNFNIIVNSTEHLQLVSYLLVLVQVLIILLTYSY